MDEFVEGFDSRIKNKLKELGVDNTNLNIGVAVSGGADSVSLLTALSHIMPENIHLFAITINHNLREKSETEGDAEFVQEYCNELGIPCERFDIPRGNILEDAKNRNIGIEAAAREARYKLFEIFSREKNISFICLGHNKNDQLETILMRFLHGSGAESLSGIPAKRGIYIRPLINISRKEIEKYLELQNIPYRTDCTNFETVMYRNCIRNAVMPVLDKEVAGWQKSMDALSEKMKDDEEVLHNMANQSFEKICSIKDNVAAIDFCKFSLEFRAVQRRILYKTFSALNLGNRVPYRFVSDIINHSKEYDPEGKNAWKEMSSGILAECNGSNIFIQKQKKIATEKGFFVIIERVGTYRIGDIFYFVELKNSEIVIKMQGNSSESVIFLENVHFPFAIRSRQNGDEIKNSFGKKTSVLKILNDWKCGSYKDLIPVIQSLGTVEQEIACIWGEAFGFKNWIVRN